MYNFNLTSENQFASPGEAAVFYNRLNWDSLVLPERKKAPKGKWGDLPRLPDEELIRKFGVTNNVGIALGERSGGLVDLDFDWPEANRIAEIVCPDLPSFGRATSPPNHRYWRWMQRTWNGVRELFPRLPWCLPSIRPCQAIAIISVSP
jgi:hypothetical protein